jgi:flagellar motility protein MotE (MotC chaperone)
MKKMIGLALYGLILFGVSAGGAWFLKSQQAADQQTAEDDTSTEVDEVEMLLQKPDPLLVPETTPEDDILPVAVRPQAMSVEEIVRYGLGLKNREQAIRNREEALQRTETQHRLILADIEGEQKEIEGLLAQARDQRMAADELLQRITAKKTELEAERLKAAEQSAAGGTADILDDEQQANLKDLTEVMQSMTPEGASEVLREFANNGKMDMAVHILANLEERRAAAILDSMEDKTLLGELVDKFTELKRPPKPQKKR